jgi:hypothetical protein
MNLTEVRSFLILAGQLHFGRAARLLHTSVNPRQKRKDPAVQLLLFWRQTHGLSQAETVATLAKRLRKRYTCAKAQSAVDKGGRLRFFFSGRSFFRFRSIFPLANYK